MRTEREQIQTLVEQARNGDPQAQEALVRLVQNRVYYHCKKMLKNEADAQDAVQDVLIVMLTSLDKLKEPAAFWGWVNGITANRCRHLLSAPHKEWQIPEDDDGGSMLEDVASLDETLVPEKALDNEETRRMILELVDNLPPEQRMCVLFYYYDEMSVKDIAQAMGTSEGTVKSRLNYARKAIKYGVEDYERQGVKLYSASPILLLLAFLRREAEATVLDSTAAAAMASQALSQAGAAAGTATAAAETAGGTAAGASAGAGTAAGTAVGAGTAATAAAGISVKVVAAVLAGVLAIGGAAIGLSSRSGQDQPPEPADEGVVETMDQPGQAEPDTPDSPEAVQPDTPEDDAFGALHGFTLVDPRSYESLPLTADAKDSGLQFLSSDSGLTQPVITVSEPDDEGYVTYTIQYTNTAQVLIGNPGDAAMAFTIISQEYSLYDWYTGDLYFPDERTDSAGAMQALGESQVEFDGNTFPITYEKQWTSGMDYGDWQESSRPGLDREITVDAYQDVTYTVRVPADYGGLLLGVNSVDAPDPQRAIQTQWDLSVDDPAHFEFVRLSDHAAPAEDEAAGGLTPEVAAVYAGVLEDQRDLLDAYVNWIPWMGIQPVALADVWGDGTPELLFVAAHPDYPMGESFLTIVTCENGQAVTLLQESWDFLAGSGLRYTVFLAEDGTLWADTNYYSSRLVEEPRSFTETADGLTMADAASLPTPAQALLSNQSEAEAAMSVDEALAYLQEMCSV